MFLGKGPKAVALKESRLVEIAETLVTSDVRRYRLGHVESSWHDQPVT